MSFRNTELIYSDAIGERVHELGFNTMLTEGAKHILGWRSPDYVYVNDRQEGLRLLLRNYKLSDDIAFRFSNKGWSEWPLTGEKYLGWLKSDAKDGDVVNLFMDYETFGEHQKAASGIFDFMRYLPEAVIKDGTFAFATPSEAAAAHNPISSLEVAEPISWADEERDVTAWLGNELQQEAFNKLYGLYEKVALINDPALFNDFGHLQESDHFYYMCTKFFSDGEVHKYFNPYDTPYEAFINYMNVLSDFIIRVNEEYSTNLAKFAASNAEPAAEEVEAAPEKEIKTAAPARRKAAAKPVKKAVAKKEASAGKATPAKKAAAEKKEAPAVKRKK